MAWDQAKVEAAFSTLSDSLGCNYSVSIETNADTEELEPVDGFRSYKIVPDSHKAIITITKKEG